MLLVALENFLIPVSYFHSRFVRHIKLTIIFPFVHNILLLQFLIRGRSKPKNKNMADDGGPQFGSRHSAYFVADMYSPVSHFTRASININ